MSKTAREIVMEFPKRFNPAALPDANSVFHFKLAGNGGGDFTATVENGTCKITEGLAGDAKCTVSSKASTFADIVQGKTNAQMAFFMGKVKVDNLPEMMKFAKPFGLM